MTRHALDTPDGVAAFQAALMKLVVQGFKPYEIAGQLQVSTSVVHRHLEMIKQYWRDSALDDAKEYFGRELETILYTRREAIEAWEKSKTIKTKNRIRAERSGKGKTGPDPESLMVPVLQEQTTEETPGDPAFLKAIQKTSDQMMDLTGLKKQVALTAQIQSANIIDATTNWRERLELFDAQQFAGIDGHDAHPEGAVDPRDDHPPKSLDSQTDRPHPETGEVSDE